MISGEAVEEDSQWIIAPWGFTGFLNVDFEKGGLIVGPFLVSGSRWEKKGSSK